MKKIVKKTYKQLSFMIIPTKLEKKPTKNEHNYAALQPQTSRTPTPHSNTNILHDHSHIIYQTNKNDKKCKYCARIFKYINKKHEHKLICASNMHVHCRKCGKKCKNYKEFYEHKRNHIIQDHE